MFNRVNSEVVLSIGLPAYNAEEFLSEVIESVLAQRFAEFELVISDDASMDRTEEIGRYYASLDGRVVYHRNPTNVGPIANFNLVYSLAHRGRYFAFKAHDDTWDSRFAWELIRLLEEQPRAVLVFCQCRVIGAKGEWLFDVPKPIDYLPAFLDERCRVARILRHAWTSAIYGIVRRSALPAANPLNDICGIAPERFFLANLAARGMFVTCNDYLYTRRLHGNNLDVFPSKYINVTKAVRLLNSGLTPNLALWEKIIVWMHLVRLTYHLNIKNLAYFMIHPSRIKKSSVYQKLMAQRSASK